MLITEVPTSSEHIKMFKIIKHQILSSWCDMSFLMWSIWSKLSLLHSDSFHIWASPTGPRCWHISKAMWQCCVAVTGEVGWVLIYDRIHPTNRTLLMGVGSGILVSQSKWQDFAEKKTKKRETQLHSRRAGEALGVPDRLRRQARGICHGDLWSKRGNIAFLPSKKGAVHFPLFFDKSISPLWCWLKKRVVFSLFCKLWSVSGQDQSRLREKH